jgi:hypothetical protein
MTTRRGERLAGLLGIASVPLLVAGALLIGLPTPAEDDPDREFVNYFTEHDGEIWLGATLTVLGLVSLLVFLTGLRTLLRRAEPERGGGAGLVLAAGTGFALFELVGVTIIAGTAGAADFFDGFALDPDTARLMLGMSWLPSIYGGLAATVVVAATSLVAKRTGILPKGFVRAGYVVTAVLFVTAFLGFGGLVFAVWVLVVGVVLITRTGGEAGAAAAPTRPAAGVPA